MKGLLILPNPTLLPVGPTLFLALFSLLTDSQYQTRQLTNSITTDQNSGPNKGAIAGGVVGGVCGVLIIAGLVWLLLRRRRRSKAWNNTPHGHVPTDSHAPILSDFGNRPSEVEGDNKVIYELHDPAPMWSELEGGQQPRQELASKTSKNAGQDQPYELP